MGELKDCNLNSIRIFIHTTIYYYMNWFTQHKNKTNKHTQIYIHTYIYEELAIYITINIYCHIHYRLDLANYKLQHHTEHYKVETHVTEQNQHKMVKSLIHIIQN